MAKITGPLFSQTASGSVGARLTFSQRKTSRQARFQNSQKDIITSRRTPYRVLYSAAVSAWNCLDLITKDAFRVFAVGMRITGYNLFVKLHISGDIVGCDASIYGFRNYGIIVYGKE